MTDHTPDNPSTNLGLDPDRLTMLDEHGGKKTIIPAEVAGQWRQRRDRVYFILIVVFLTLPWTRINGAQTILLDIVNRKFALFGITFWAHDAPLIFLIFVILVFGLAFVTAIWGRVWCGWACPQTVFIDFVYRKIEILVEGKYLERRKLALDDLSFEKIIKKITKWIIFFAVSSFIAHSFTAYFVGSQNLTEWVLSGNTNEHWVTFLIISFITGVLLFDFGWFREQFCIIMCPYGRFQSVLMDKRSLAVLYDENRGEPRKGLKHDQNKKQGDCVSCQRCVQVCPTGIDIRKGLQLECIACTACIDACDEIMEKVNKPKGLIRYASVSGLRNKVTYWRPLLYLAIISIAIVVLTFVLSTRKSVDFAVLRAKETPYQIVKGTQGEELVMNHFKVHAKNQSTFDIKPFIKFSEPKLAESSQIKTQENPFFIKAGENKTIHFFVIVPKSSIDGSGILKINIIFDYTTQNGVLTTQDFELSLQGPIAPSEGRKNE